MTEQTMGAAVRRAVTVKAPIEHAFDVFTRQMGRWWPRETHHVGPTPARAIMEPFAGGRWFERGRASRGGRPRSRGRRRSRSSPGP